jgi:hypothetical protein
MEGREGRERMKKESCLGRPGKEGIQRNEQKGT